MSFWAIYLLPLLVSVNLISAENVIGAFQENDIVPEIINATEIQCLKVIYEDAEVNLGNELTPTQVKDMPNVTWDDDYQYYTLIMADPDAPSRDVPALSPFLHWLVVNITGGNVINGDTLAEYVGSAPPLGTGLHRYIFFLFRQPGKLTFDEPPLGIRGTLVGRTRFSITGFAEKYNLDLQRGNFFLAQFDGSVTATLDLLGV